MSTLAHKLLKIPRAFKNVVGLPIYYKFYPALRRINFSVFGNTLTLRMNFLHWSYHLFCRLTWRMSHFKVHTRKNRQLCKDIDREGYFKSEPHLTPKRIDEIRSKVDAAFENPENLGPMPDSSNVKRLKLTVDAFPELLEFFDGELAEQLETFFGCHVKLFSIDLYQLHAFHSDANTAEWWHFDNTPNHQLKVIVYLSDSDKNSGALSIKPKPVSVAFKKRGYWDRFKAEELKEEVSKDGSTIVLEGAKGTKLFLQVSTVLHKATPPKMGHRTTLAFLVVPSLVPWKEHYQKMSAKTPDYLSRNQGYCINPWNNRALRYGYK